MTELPALDAVQFTAYCDGWLLGRAGSPSLPAKPEYGPNLTRLRNKGWSDAMAGLDRQFTVAQE